MAALVAVGVLGAEPHGPKESYKELKRLPYAEEAIQGFVGAVDQQPVPEPLENVG